MYVAIRLPHIRNTRTKLIQCCRSLALSRECACLSNCRVPSPDLYDFKRHYGLTSHTNLFESNNRVFWIRNISLSHIKCDKEPLKPSSKVEATVQELKKQKEEDAKVKVTDIAPKPVVKKSIAQKVVDELVHYYHGFRLLFIDVKISAGLVFRVLRGKTLTRREYRLLTRTVGDLFRLVPFSVFIIVPFMELLLPVFIKLFPGMLPSTFQTSSEKEDKLKQNLKVKLEMAKFLQGTLDEMSVQHKDRYSEKAKEFVEWFNKVRTSGELVSNHDIIKFSKLFEDEITLDSLSRSQLIALCRVLEVNTLGTNNFLRFQLRMKLRQLAADDKMIQKEGVHSLTLSEVQQACRARGMRAYGVTESRLRSQLNQWLDLSLNEKVPPSLLLLSRALMLPETIPTGDKLKATISSLPETILKQTQASIGEKEGKIDNKIRVELLKEEEKKIKEERIERRTEEEILVDKAPTISAASTPILEDTALRISAEKLERVEKMSEKEEEIHSKDIEIIEHAIDTVSKDKKLIVEKEEIQELKAEMADYKEDVEELSKAVADTPKPEIKETKAAKRLFKSVNKMISNMDQVLDNLEKKEAQLKKDLEAGVSDHKQEELLKIDDIIAAIHKIKDVPDQSRLEKIEKVLRKIDDDHDGSLKVEDVVKVIEIIGKENVKLSSKQIDEVMQLIDKEEILEVEDKIEKALQKDKAAKQAERLEEKAKIESKREESSNEGEGKEKSDQGSGTQAKPKMDSRTVIPPPPSIEKKTENSSKML
ncbi:mitochondrial proton/calcium exchanger protein [Cylas formicarius]|uniref:mitochondrial proton/calcium exchanger protein n=1 Tax=Cylas formicarius TaxID=197179 RepID=UPI002958A61E|nr:mitochondrial proton/calcium exchanger protein [Cylas formicarius]